MPETEDIKDFVKDVGTATMYVAFVLGGAAVVKTVLVAFLGLL